MPKRPPGLSLDPKGDDFILRRTSAAGKTMGMTLSDEDVLTLAQSAPLFRDRILSKRTPEAGAISAVFVTPVERAHLTVDILENNVLLTMIAPSGASIGFSLPEEIARLLVERMPVYLAQLRAAKPTRQ